MIFIGAGVPLNAPGALGLGQDFILKGAHPRNHASLLLFIRNSLLPRLRDKRQREDKSLQKNALCLQDKFELLQSWALLNMKKKMSSYFVSLRIRRSQTENI